MPWAAIAPALIAAAGTAASTAIGRSNAGGSFNYGAGETTDDVMKAYIKNLPAYTAATNKQLLPTGQSELDAQRALQPQQYDQLVKMFSTYGPQIGDLVNKLNLQGQSGGISNDLTTLMSPESKGLVTGAQNLLKETDPEYFKSRGVIGDKLTEGLGALSAGVSPTERAEMLRSAGRTSAAGPESALGTIEAAQQFGDKATAKANALVDAVSTASYALPRLRSGADFYGIATGKAGLGSSASAGAMFNDLPPNMGKSSYGNSANLFNAASTFGGNQQGLRARNAIDPFQNFMGNVPSVIGGLNDLNDFHFT